MPCLPQLYMMRKCPCEKCPCENEIVEIVEIVENEVFFSDRRVWRFYFFSFPKTFPQKTTKTTKTTISSLDITSTTHIGEGSDGVFIL